MGYKKNVMRGGLARFARKLNEIFNHFLTILLTRNILKNRVNFKFL